MFNRVLQSHRLNIHFTIQAPSKASIEAIIHMLKHIPKFYYLSVNYTVSDMRGYETLRSSTYSMSQKEDVIDVLNKVISTDTPDLTRS